MHRRDRQTGSDAFLYNKCRYKHYRLAIIKSRYWYGDNNWRYAIITNTTTYALSLLALGLINEYLCILNRLQFKEYK